MYKPYPLDAVVALATLEKGGALYMIRKVMNWLTAVGWEPRHKRLIVMQRVYHLLASNLDPSHRSWPLHNVFLPFPPPSLSFAACSRQLFFFFFSFKWGGGGAAGVFTSPLTEVSARRLNKNLFWGLLMPDKNLYQGSGQ